ncbi:glycosyltransferase [Klebsiella pneumoniae]|uniref:glycosyltransferase n=1 Tax=Klebsiella pneumoniae TaxID=573 RepID=UPI0022B6F681|nr:glycosyltransferase [Klebsiella pneumoniae]MCZ7738994.1 glycosyltransferase [Klebsiella pneumoniae]
MNNTDKVNKKVSVYISTHNRLERLKRAIQSVLNQEYSNLELLVCDDASNDGTKEYMEELCSKDNRVKYFRNDVNKGACATRNLGIRHATGFFITGLDDDDEFTFDRIKLFVENWDDRYSFLSCNFYDCYKIKHKKIHYKKNLKPIILTYKDILFKNLASNQVFTLTERLRSINGFDVNVKRLQDWDTWLRLSAKYGEFMVLPYATYLMHHDHLPGEQRVSKAYPFSRALHELKMRNNQLYDKEEQSFVDYLVALESNNGQIVESIKWALKRKDPKYIAKYLIQYVNKNTNK